MSVSSITAATNAILLSDFPYLAQVFQVESWVKLTGCRSRHEIRYGLTSLPASVASPERLLALVRGQGVIEVINQKGTFIRLPASQQVIDVRCTPTSGRMTQ